MTSRDTVASTPIPMSVLGMMLFIASEVMFFAALFAAYFAVRDAAPIWPPEGGELEIVLPIAITVLLVSSSLTITFGEKAAARGDVRKAARWAGVTILLGALFLAGQMREYSTLDLPEGSFATLFFTMTGFHGLHVLVGVLALIVATVRLLRKGAARDVAVLEAASYYWHFVDVVWLLLFVTLYLVT